MCAVSASPSAVLFIAGSGCCIQCNPNDDLRGPQAHEVSCSHTGESIEVDAPVGFDSKGP